LFPSNSYALEQSLNLSLSLSLFRSLANSPYLLPPSLGFNAETLSQIRAFLQLSLRGGRAMAMEGAPIMLLAYVFRRFLFFS
jgi:hypothetical protein